MRQPADEIVLVEYSTDKRALRTTLRICVCQKAGFLKYGHYYACLPADGDASNVKYLGQGHGASPSIEPIS